jgi:xanthine dehydrogenase YagS FAD-binding subunit
VTATVAFSDKNGSVSDARVVLGHVAATPWMASTAAKALNGARIDMARLQFLQEQRRRVEVGSATPLDEKLAQLESSIPAGVVSKCADAAVEGAKPLSRNAYKLQLAKTAVKRAVLAAAT